MLKQPLLDLFHVILDGWMVFSHWLKSYYELQGYLSEADLRQKGHSTSDDSITHSMSDVSVGPHQQGSAPNTPTAQHTNRDRPVSKDK